MTEHPIIFSAPMIRALLSGAKTQTRRIIRPQPAGGESITTAFGGFHVGRMRDSENAWRPLKCHYGVPGDRLWVGETWRFDDWTEDGEPFIRYRADNSVHGPLAVPEELSDRINDIWAELSNDFKRKGRACDEVWRPSIYMYRFMSRLTLELTGVKVERVQDISEADAIAEGFDSVQQFLDYFDSLNAKRGYPASANPWVWVPMFKRVEARP